MTNWQPIDSAPKDGTRVWVKRVYEGSTVSQGWAVWGVNSADAPMRQTDHEYADEPRWLVESRRYSFPTPTHWMPLPPPPQEPTHD